MAQDFVPTCPKCKAAMRLRHSSHGDFWGCTNYPRCKHTIDVKDELPAVMAAATQTEQVPEWKARAAARVKAMGGEVADEKAASEPKYKPITKLPGSTEQEAIWKELLAGKTHIVVEAVAGSGKTWTMVQACLRLAKTLKIGFIAFNKHIAEEAQGKLSVSGCLNVTACTSHSLGLGFIRAAYPRARIDENKTDEILKGYDNPLPYGPNRERDWHAVMALTRKLVGFAKNYLLDDTTPDLSARLEELCNHHAVDTNGAGNEVRRALELVPRVLRDSKARAQFSVDFDDMIWLPVVLNLRAPSTFDILIVDEAQDTNVCQQALIMRACPTGRVVIVGDRYQSIYGFRGADVTAIPSIIERLRDTKRGVTICPLTVTRRCPSSHVVLAQAIVPHIQALDTAPVGEVESLSIDRAEASMRPGDLVVCRCNAPLIPTAYRLIKAGTKAVIRGRDIGKGLLELMNKLQVQSGASDLTGLVAALNDYRIVEVNKLLPLGDKAESRIADMQDKCDCMLELVSGASTIPDLRSKIESLFSDFESDGAPKHAVILGTVHRTKGLEGTTVFVLEPEKIPHPMAKQPWEQEQERNLAYVAATRAKYDETHPGRLVFCGMAPSIYSAVVQSAEEPQAVEEPEPVKDQQPAAVQVSLLVDVVARDGGWVLNVGDWAVDQFCKTDADVAMAVAVAVQRALSETSRVSYMNWMPGDLRKVEE